MWEKLLKYAQDAFHLKQRTDTNSADIEKLQKQVEQLSKSVERLSLEFQHLKDSERHERESLALRLENVLLRFERRLPGKPDPDDRYLTEWLYSRGDKDALNTWQQRSRL
jgi:hypothetical protein